MASHLTDIGFYYNTDEEIRELIDQAYELGELLRVEQGGYFRWSPGEGVEIWGQLDNKDNCIGFNPHFDGESVISVGLTARLQRIETSVLDGAFHAWANPSGDDAESGFYPFIFDAPDFRLCDSVKLPGVVEARIAAFAHELSAFESDEAYYASQSNWPRFGAESFFPTGLFTEEMESTDPPQAYAIFTGHVLNTALKINPVTKSEFLWAKVQTFGGVFDVVADPVIVNGAVVEGGIVHGAFWLSGRLQHFDNIVRLNPSQRFFSEEHYVKYEIQPD
ncbi:MAG: hypothetical protein J2P21_24795 [Chloracidobacterium sp.]|nr:hypothetical protein [Chloracidobacterium sp.]